MTNLELTTEDRWNLAVREIRELGVKLCENLVPDSGDKNDVDPDECNIDYFDDETPYAWSAGIDADGEENGYEFGLSILWEYYTQLAISDLDEDDEDYVDGYERTELTREWKGEIEFHTRRDAGQIVANAFIKQGFQVTWNKGDEDSVFVNPKS